MAGIQNPCKRRYCVTVAAMTTKEQPATEANREAGLSDASDTANHTAIYRRYRQMIIVRGEARRRLVGWLGGVPVFVTLLPLSEPGVLGMGGVGPWFEPVLHDTILAACGAPAPVSDPDAPLGELVEFLRKEVKP